MNGLFNAIDPLCRIICDLFIIEGANVISFHQFPHTAFKIDRNRDNAGASHDAVAIILEGTTDNGPWHGVKWLTQLRFGFIATRCAQRCIDTFLRWVERAADRLRKPKVHSHTKLP